MIFYDLAFKLVEQSPMAKCLFILPEQDHFQHGGASICRQRKRTILVALWSRRSFFLCLERRLVCTTQMEVVVLQSRSLGLSILFLRVYISISNLRLTHWGRLTTPYHDAELRTLALVLQNTIHIYINGFVHFKNHTWCRTGCESNCLTY